MATNIYTTEGIILKKYDMGEADSLFSFFTKDFGRIDIKAQGIRYLKSKLRYHLSGFSFIRISFIGTSGDRWRLVDVEELETLDDIRRNKEKVICFLNILSLCARMIHGQEPGGIWWGELKHFFSILEGRKFFKNDLKNFEILVRSHMLVNLGYLDFNMTSNCKEVELGVLLSEIEEKKECFVKAIEDSLEQSQL